ARALVGSPAILFADEPTGNLDTESSREIMAILGRLNHEDRITVIVVTHDSDVATYASRRIVIRDGRIYEDRLTINPATVLE
ncbi:MAG TPA: macrolide ABC transporter ATP-binding protein, partial [Nitrospiraceae bacterium]|nr:macrolide ABC transporter ATP-binding protein [Nitrospiraceae bacterium]